MRLGGEGQPPAKLASVIVEDTSTFEHLPMGNVRHCISQNVIDTALPNNIEMRMQRRRPYTSAPCHGSGYLLPYLA
jgi:hypothetical protein